MSLKMSVKNRTILCVFLLLSLVSACKKTADVVPIPAVVGSWKLDRVVLTELPTDYSALNGKSLDPLQYFGVQSVYNFANDNSFTDKETQSGIISDYSGTWTYTSNSLSLIYSDKSTEAYTYDDTTKLLSSGISPLTLSLTNPNTQQVESIVCKYQLIYAKQ
jgi:hypothetical protein